MSCRVVILGGGFAGCGVARALSRRLPEAEVTLVNEENYTTFTPMLPEVVSSTVLPGQVIAPLRLMLRENQNFVMGRAEAVDPAARTVQVRAGETIREFGYDHLVLALGSRAAMGMLPGLETHGIALKLIGDAMKVRNRVIARLEEASVTEDPAHRARLCHFVIVGGGFSGVEVAGEIHDFLRAARRHYPAIPEELLRVCVVHAGERILPEVSPKLSRRAADNMTARGIELLLNAKASGADETGLDVDIPDGRERLDTATVISTIGTGPNPVIGALDLGMEKGRLRTEADMSVPGAEGLWALGDCAAVPNAASGETSPPTAQFALRQADDLARNIQAREAGQETRDFDFDGYGTIATIGSKRGVAEVMGVPVTGFPAWLLWRAVYLFRMPTLSRKVQIYVAWTWAMLFPSDIAQLRFTASDAADRR